MSEENKRLKDSWATGEKDLEIYEDGTVTKYVEKYDKHLELWEYEFLEFQYDKAMAKLDIEFNKRKNLIRYCEASLKSEKLRRQLKHFKEKEEQNKRLAEFTEDDLERAKNFEKSMYDMIN